MMINNSNNAKYDKALFPKIGLVIEFKHATDAIRYVNIFFPDYFSGAFDIQMYNLTRIGAIKTIVKTDFFNKPESTSYQLDCNTLLSHLGILESTSTQNEFQLYTIQEVANIFSVTRQSIYNLINSGYFNPILLKGIKGQRIRRKEVIEYLDKQ
jgi:hypothetical protein